MGRELLCKVFEGLSAADEDAFVFSFASINININTYILPSYHRRCSCRLNPIETRNPYPNAGYGYEYIHIASF